MVDTYMGVQWDYPISELKIVVDGSELIDMVTSTVTFNDVLEVTDSDKGIIIQSPNNTRYRIQVDDDGNLITTAL